MEKSLQYSKWNIKIKISQYFYYSSIKIRCILNTPKIHWSDEYLDNGIIVIFCKIVSKIFSQVFTFQILKIQRLMIYLNIMYSK
jgi:hypothetical protein